MESIAHIKELIKRKDISYIRDLSCEIVEYYPKNEYITGKLYVTGRYVTKKNEDEKLVSEDIPFNILLGDEKIIIEDIDCSNFSYYVSENAGIEIEAEITIKYFKDEEKGEEEIVELPTLEYEKVEVDDIIDENREKEKVAKEENEPEKIEENKEAEETICSEETDVKTIEQNNEVIKKLITKKIDEKLKIKLDMVDDNLPTLDNLNDQKDKQIYDVFYYNKEQDLENIASRAKCSLNSLYDQNKDTNMALHHRVIVNRGHKGEPNKGK